MGKPVYDGGSAVTGYVVAMRQGEGRGNGLLSLPKEEVRTTEYVVSNLSPGVNYYFQVSAVNCAGQGEPIAMTEPAQARDILGAYLLM